MTAMTATTTPADVAEVRDAVLDHPGPLLVTGAGTAADWAGTPSPTGLAVSTGRLTGVVTHNPGDMTVSVRAGTPLAELQAAVGEHGQRVAFDPARAARGATLGGLFATADAGPLALSYGTLRDLVIGVTVVLADGTVARSGGHVIKNVAGYDLSKLLHGAHGTLGLIVELVLRLHPLPSAVTTLALPCPLAEMSSVGRDLSGHPIEVGALEWVEEAPGEGRLLARVEGTDDGVRGRVDRLRDAVGGEELDADAADRAWRAHAAAVDARPGDGAVLRLGVAPSRLTEVLDALRERTGAGGITAAPATGVATLTLPLGDTAGPDTAGPDLVTTAHALVAEAGGTSSLRHRPDAAVLPAWAPAPSSAGLLRAVAASFDPDQRFGRGRLAPWLPEPTGVTA